MKAQTLFLAASAIIGALAAPVQRREAQPDVITVYENVVHVVTTTSTVWVPPSTPTPTPAPEKKVEEVKEEPEEEVEEPEEEPEEKPEEVEVKKPSPTPTPTPSLRPEPTTTSVYIPPTTTKAQTTQAPAPSKAAQAAPEPEEKAEEVEASTPDQQETQTGGASHTGDGTYYTPAMGSCGSDEHTEADLVAALPKAIMEASEIGGNPNNNPLCGKSVEVTRGSKKVKVIVVDKCMGCAPDDIDLSPAAFNQLGAPAEGRITVSWKIL